MLEEPASSFMKLHREDKLESTGSYEVPYTDGDNNKSWQEEENVPLGEDGRGDVGQLRCHATSTNTRRCDEEEKISAKRTDPTCCVPDDDKKQEVLGVGHDYFHSEDKVKPQSCDTRRAEGAEFSCDQPSESQSSVSGRSSSKEELKESINGQIKQETDAETEKASASRSYIFGFFADKLSEAYKDAGRRLQGTRDIIRNVQLAEMKVVLSQYVTMVSKELPLIHQLELQPQPETEISAESKVPSMDLPVPQKCNISVILDVSGCPEGSVSSVRNTSPEVFHQKLVELPSALSQLRTSSSQEMQEHLGFLFPQMQGNKLLGIFWLRTANRKRPAPKPGCLLLSEKDVTVVSADTDSTDTLTVFHHFKLLEIKEVQISLAGQHVRLIGSTEDTILAVFTHSKDLTQEFCKALLKALSPETVLEGHPLLSDDLMALSLDWTSNVPDIILDSGLSVTSRFKRVLADLLYIVHGNMEAPSKPSLANIRPLLYASVKVKSAPRVLPGAIFQFLLTDTHVALLREDGVFHPVPRGSSLVPTRPQFQGLELRQRSDVRCLLVKQDDGCLVLEIVFTNRKPQKRKVVLRRGSADPTGGANVGSDSWKHLVSRNPATSCDGVQEPVKVSIPRYVLRGQGKDEHFEFEVKITVMDDSWTVFRRYSRFREMHRSLKLKYPELAALEFPPKKLFGNRDERMVAERRSHLERYLRNLFRVMLSSSSSPLRTDRDVLLSKRDVCEFSPFFKKGVFEHSSHGTG